MSWEIWKEVPGYENEYMASDNGRVKCIKYGKERILGFFEINGYAKYDFSKNGERATLYGHQIIAMTFLNHKPNGHKRVVDHINFNRLDNRVENLRIVSQRENTNRKHINSSSKYVGVSWKKKNKKWTANIRHNGKQEYLGLFNTEVEASIAYKNRLAELNNNKMNETYFTYWLTNAVPIWQGEPDYPSWELTDGGYSVIVDIGKSYKITHSDFTLTMEQAERIFDLVSAEEHERLNELTPSDDDIDDWEHGLYGYGY